MLVDWFDNPTGTGWALSAGGLQDGVLSLQGDNNWNGLGRQTALIEGQGVLLAFRYTRGSEFEMYMDHGEWNTDPYRRFGVYIYGVSGYPKANLWQGRNGLGFNNLVGNFDPASDTWYQLLMVVGPDADFLAVIWDPNDQTNQIKYQESIGERWAGLDWVFHIGANAGAAEFAEYAEVSFSSLK